MLCSETNNTAALPDEVASPNLERAVRDMRCVLANNDVLVGFFFFFSSFFFSFFFLGGGVCLFCSFLQRSPPPAKSGDKRAAFLKIKSSQSHASWAAGVTRVGVHYY